MKIIELISSIKQDLTSMFGIPVEVEEILKGENDTHLFVFETTSKMELGFSIDLTWRRLVLKSRPRYAVPNIQNLCKVWKNQLEENRIAFDFYRASLEEMKCKLGYDFNHVETTTLSFPESCYYFSVQCKSSYLETLDGMDYHYENFSPIIRNYWGLVVSFISHFFVEDDNLPLEGMQVSSESTSYERHPIYRKICLAFYGYKCQICHEDLTSKYGKLAENYIEVHHIEPVSTYEIPKVINPVVDLIPVCPNCHAMLHRRKPPLTPEELVGIIKGRK